MTTIWSNDDYGKEYTPKVKANEVMDAEVETWYNSLSSHDQDKLMKDYTGTAGQDGKMHYSDAKSEFSELDVDAQHHIHDVFHNRLQVNQGASQKDDWGYTLDDRWWGESRGDVFKCPRCSFKTSDDDKWQHHMEEHDEADILYKEAELEFANYTDKDYERLGLKWNDDHSELVNLDGSQPKNPMHEVHGSSVNGYDAKEFKNFCLACAGRGFMFPTGMRCPNCKGTGIYDSEREYEDPKPSVSRAPDDKPYSPLSDQEPRTASGNRLYEAVCEDCMGSGTKSVYNKHRVRAGDDGSFRAGHFKADYQFPCKKCAGGGYVKKEDQPTNILDTEPEWRIANKRHSDVKEGRPKDKRQTQIFNAPPENLARIGNLKQEGDPDWTTTPDPSGHTWNEFGQKEKTSRSNYTQYHDRPRAKAEQDANRGDIEHDSLEDPLSWYSSEDIMPLSELKEASTEIQDIYPTDPVGDDLRDNPNLSDYHYNMDASQMYDLYVDTMKKHLGDYTRNATPEKLQRAKELLDGWSQNTMIFDMPNSKRNSPEGIKEFTHAKHFVQMWLDSWIQTVSGTMPDPSWESKASEASVEEIVDILDEENARWQRGVDTAPFVAYDFLFANMRIDRQSAVQAVIQWWALRQNEIITEDDIFQGFDDPDELDYQAGGDSATGLGETVRQMTGHTGEAHKHEWVSGTPAGSIATDKDDDWCEICGVSRDEVDEVKYGDDVRTYLEKLKDSDKKEDKKESEEDLSIDLKPKTEDDISHANKDHLLLEQFRG